MWGELYIHYFLSQGCAPKIYMEDVNDDNRIRRQILGGGGNRRTINEPYNNNNDSYLYDDYNKR